MAVLGAFEITRVVAQERPRDHAADLVVAIEQVTGDLTHFVKTVDRDHFLVSGDLENRVGRGIDDRLTGPDVFLTELFNDLGPACRHVPEHTRNR